MSQQDRRSKKKLFEDRKITADRQWDSVYKNTLERKINIAEIVYAMELCNMADKNLIKVEQSNEDNI